MNETKRKPVSGRYIFQNEIVCNLKKYIYTENIYLNKILIEAKNFIQGIMINL